ncbi:extracellular solute-binding protein [Paracoccus sp. p3-h83]|uniref:extracellular solute-binding protein n=1 Tax=Paracoccus sp. p3-h83 TaxID=3342805 RepID=UPI0035BB0D4E
MAQAEPKHAIAMYGQPALAADFTHLPYANPDAPKGGTIRFGEPGGFDSLNPWILKGNAPWGLGLYVTESLMARSIDEPFTLYCLLCETVETDDARSWVEFTLRPDARFSDGSPVTVEDVMWSYETLGTKGHPRYQGAWAKIDRMEQTGPLKLRFTFKQPDRELTLLMGMRPILKKAQWEGKDFTASGLDSPIGSGPYTIGKFEAGRYVTFVRNPDYWGRDLPVNKGRNNFDEVRYDYFGDGDVVFQAFKAGDLDFWRETNPAKWASQYDYPAVRDGKVIKAEIPHQRPSGIIGWMMNTRNPIFADWRVRQAMIEAFNFDFINTTLSGGADPRICSYFCNSPLAMGEGPATGKVAELLAPFAADLPPGTIEGYALPQGNAERAQDRGGLRRAAALLAEAGWTVQDGVLKNAEGTPFTFEVLLAQGASESQQMMNIYTEALKGLGIQPKVTVVDSAQYAERTNSYAYDMIYRQIALSLSPGNEQMLYWGAKGVTEPGSRNYMGMNSPAAEAMVNAMLTATAPEDFTAAVQALDRVLTAGRYVIPVTYPKVTRIAYKADLHYPETLPLYGDWPGFMPEVWWKDAAK